MKPWTSREEKQLRELYPVNHTRDLVEFFGRTDKAINSRVKLLGLIKTGDLARRAWTTEEDQYMRDNYPDGLGNEVARHLGRSMSSMYGRANILGLSKSESFKLSDFSGRLNGVQGRNTQFKKGHVPANKGKKMTPELREKVKHTFFSKGHIPKNHQPVGTIAERNNYKRRTCYLYIKIKEPNKWIPLQHYVWIQAGNDLPEGMNLIFKDGNSKNCTVENLELISNGELMKKNTIHRYPEELRNAIFTQGQLKRKIREHEEQN